MALRLFYDIRCILLLMLRFTKTLAMTESEADVSSEEALMIQTLRRQQRKKRTIFARNESNSM